MKTLSITKRAVISATIGALLAMLIMASAGGATGQGSTSATNAARGAKPNKAPTIIWTPSSLTYTVAPGTRQVVPIKFTTSKELEDVRVSVTPALLGVLQVSPSSVQEIDKGKIGTLYLTISPAGGSVLGVLEGNIHFSTRKATVGTPFPITIVVATGVVGALPPDPGEAGKTTLAGIDSNNNGVRDDTERYIWLTYPTSERTRSALLQTARSFQDQFSDLTSSTAVLSAVRGVQNASACLSHVVGSQAAYTIGKNLETQFLNTQTRWDAMNTFSTTLRGQILLSTPPSERRAACGFDPDILPN